ncbi:MAG: SEC-C domain-containing protein [Opitutaceae bacterium]|nr:SEC-C domain-containing protein [Opitutaceae bacterium]
MLTGSIYALRLWELRGTVAALFDRELVDPCYLGDRDEVLALLPDGAVPSPDDHEFPPPINDAWETVRGWHYFSPSYAAEEVETNDEFIPVPARLDPQPHRAPPKIGRNDPCPCGSGKKYKKCCGA